jgi:hypothetical protein
MIRDREQTVGIRWEIDACNRGAFVEYYIQKSRVLMREAIMILTPHC